MLHEDVSGLASGLEGALRGSDEQMKNESVSPAAMLLERHAEPSTLENAFEPSRSASVRLYVPASGAITVKAIAEAPIPLPT